MRRLSLFIPSANEAGHIQIVVKECDKEELEAMGFVDHSDKLNKLPTANPEKVDDYGQHVIQVKAMDDKKLIESYVKDVTGINIDLRGQLETVQKKAIGALDTWKQQAH